MLAATALFARSTRSTAERHSLETLNAENKGRQASAAGTKPVDDLEDPTSHPSLDAVTLSAPARDAREGPDIEVRDADAHPPPTPRQGIRGSPRYRTAPDTEARNT